MKTETRTCVRGDIPRRMVCSSKSQKRAAPDTMRQAVVIRTIRLCSDSLALRSFSGQDLVVNDEADPAQDDEHQDREVYQQVPLVAGEAVGNRENPQLLKAEMAWNTARNRGPLTRETLGEGG